MPNTIEGLFNTSKTKDWIIEKTIFNKENNKVKIFFFNKGDEEILIK